MSGHTPWSVVKERLAAARYWREQPMRNMPSKEKYRVEKTRGKNKPSHNDKGVSTRRHASDAERREIQAWQPKVTLVLLPSGKRRFVREYPTGGTD
jgi:hypothetical protein